MIIAYAFLLVIWIVSFIIMAIAFESEGAAADALHVLLCVGSLSICLLSLIGLILSAKTGKVYRSEYDKIIQNIDSDKTKVFKEDDEITDIYITVNGQEYHFEFKEKKSK